MNKRSFLLATGLLFFGLSTIILAADSCGNYSGKAKDVCNATMNTKDDFYKKYSMNAKNPSQNQIISSCSNLSGIAKDACVTKNNFVQEHMLNKSSTSVSAPTSVPAPAPAPQTIQSAQPQSSEVQSGAEQVTTEQAPKGSSRVNIFNN